MTDRLAITQPRVATRKMTHALDSASSITSSAHERLNIAKGKKSIIGWFRYKGPANGNTIANIESPNFGQFRFNVEATTKRLFIWVSNWTTGNAPVKPIDKVEENKWHRVIATFDADTLECKLYLNGELIGTGISTVTPLDSEYAFNVYTVSNGGTQLADFAVYDKIITDEEAKTDFDNAVLPKDPMLHYKMDNVDGATLVDYGSLGLDIEPVNPFWTTETPMKEKVAVPSVMPHVLHYASGNYTTVTHNASLALGGTTPFAIDVEIAPTSNTTVQRIFAQQLEILIRTTTSATYEFIVNSLSTIDRVQAGINVPNKMTRLLCQYTGTKLQIFQDGVLAGEVSPTGTYATRTDDYIFGIGSGETFAGRQKAPKMWVNTYLTPTEIYNLHHHNIIPENGLVGNWDRISDDDTKLLNSADPTGATDGTISGATRVTEPLALGRTPRKAIVPYVGSISGDGVNDEIVLTDSASLRPTTAITTDVIFRKDNLGVSSILFGRPAGTTDYLPTIQNTNDFRFNLKLSITNVNFNTSGVYAVQKNKWTRVTCTYDSATGLAYIYVDGILVKSGTGAGTITNPGDWKVLGSSGLGFVDGEVAQVRMYNRALTTEEAETLNLTNTTPYDNDPSICVLNLEAKSGQFSIDTYGNDAIWLDQSGNGNNGAMIGCSASVDAPSKARKLVIDNLLYKYNGDFTTFPAFVAKQTVGGRVVSGNDGGALVGAEGYPTSEKQIFKWRCDMYQVTNGRAWYDIDSVYGPYKSGVGMVLEGKSVKERVNITQGQRNFGDLDNSEDIARNLIPVKPSTNYRATIRYKCFHLANEVGDSASYGLDVNMIGHTATRFTAHHRINEGIIPLVQSDDFVVATLEYTTDSDELFCNPFISIRGNSSNYADIGVAIDYIRLEEI
jgi:hypothetical protein